MIKLGDGIILKIKNQVVIGDFNQKKSKKYTLTIKRIKNIKVYTKIKLTKKKKL